VSVKRKGEVLGLSGAVLASLLAAAPALAASPTKDECIMANESAQTLRQNGKLRAARADLLVCVSKSCPGPLVDDCTQLLAAVDKAIPTLVFAVTDRDGNDVSSVSVKMDGELLAGRLDGGPITVDPGEHLFRLEAPGVSPVDKNLVVRETEKERRVVVALDAAGPGASSGSRWPAYAAFGAGTAGLILGSVFGALALSTKSALDSECPSKMGCNVGDVSSLSTRAWVANAGFGVAIVGAGAGTILLFSSGRGGGAKAGASVRARVGVGSFTLLGTLPW
jgi:hypothetical protein